MKRRHFMSLAAMSAAAAVVPVPLAGLATPVAPVANTFAVGELISISAMHERYLRPAMRVMFDEVDRRTLEAIKMGTSWQRFVITADVTA